MMQTHTTMTRRKGVGRRGSAAIEFALAIPILLVLVAGTAEIGFGVHEAMQVYNSVEAGALYASKHGFDVTGISNAVVNATGTSGITATPAPTSFCGCPSAGGVAPATCGAVCGGGGTAGTYVRVNASYTHETILNYPSFGLPTILTAQSIVRVN